MPYKGLSSVSNVLLYVLVFSLGTGWNPVPPASAQTVGPAVQQALQTVEQVRVLVVLKIPGGPGPTVSEHRRAIAQVQHQVLAQVREEDFHVVHRYTTVPALAGIVTARGLAALRATSAVERVDLDAPGAGAFGGRLFHIL